MGRIIRSGINQWTLDVIGRSTMMTTLFQREMQKDHGHTKTWRELLPLESFDCAQTSFIKHLDVSEDVEDILERNLSIFEDILQKLSGMKFTGLVLIGVKSYWRV